MDKNITACGGNITTNCVDPTPDGVTCFSYTHCLNARSQHTGVLQDVKQPIVPKTLPKVGASSIVYAIIFTIIATLLFVLVRNNEG